MADKCQHTSAAAPSCELSALPHKPFCSKHTQKSGSIEEMEQVNQTGLSSKSIQADLKRKPAAVDPETAALQADQPEPAFARDPSPARRALDPEVHGSLLAEQLVQAEMEERMARFGLTEGRPYRAEGSNKKIPFRCTPRRVRADSTAMIDPQTGENLLPPGWVGRWVREKDHLDRPTAARVIEFEDYDYEPVKTRDNKTLTGHLGVAMMAPPQQYALRVKEKAPLGGVTRDTLLEGAESVVREGNRALGVKAARVHVSDEHGSERRLHEAST